MRSVLVTRDAIQARVDLCGIAVALETYKAHSKMLGIPSTKWLEYAAENAREMSLRQKARGFKASAEFYADQYKFLTGYANETAKRENR